MLSHTCLTTKEPLRALQFTPITNLAHSVLKSYLNIMKHAEVF